MSQISSRDPYWSLIILCVTAFCGGISADISLPITLREQLTKKGSCPDYEAKITRVPAYQLTSLPAYQAMPLPLACVSVMNPEPHSQWVWAEGTGEPETAA